MLEMYQRVIADFEARVAQLNLTRMNNVPCRPLEVIILGQQALLVQHKKLAGLTLLATTDFDAQLRGEVPLEDIFKNCLRECGITYDEESHMIWMPAETKYEQLYESEYLSVMVPLPVYLLLSKAKYAKKKNRQLIVEAIADDTLSDELLELMDMYDVDVEYFLGEEADE